MNNITLTRAFGTDGFCPSTEPIPEINYRRSSVLCWPNTGQIREYPDDPLYGVITSARYKFSSLSIPSQNWWDLPPLLLQSLKDALWECWFKVLINRKAYWLKQLSFSAQLDMSFSPDVQTLIPVVWKSVKDIFLEDRWYNSADISTKVFTGKESPKIRVISDFDPSKTRRRGRTINWAFVPEPPRY